MLRRREMPKFNLLSYATRMAILRRQSRLLMFLALLGSLGSVAFAWQFVAPLRAAAGMSDWVDVPSEILESHAIERSGIDIVALLFPEFAGVRYAPWIRYSYRYEGAFYIGSALSPAEEMYNTLEGAEARLAHFETGMTPGCRVNPESPRESVLSRYVVPASFQMVWLVGAIILAGANIPLIQKRRQMRRATRQERRFTRYIEDAQPDQDFSRFSDLRNDLSFEFATATSDGPVSGEGSGEDGDVPSFLAGPGLVNKIIEDALEAAATEVLFQTRDSVVQVSYRITGVLGTVVEISEESVGAFREELARLSGLTGPDAGSAAVSVHHHRQQYTLRTVSETLPWGERTTLHLGSLPKT
ncbi:MAG: hypothetical protein IID08_02560 [Candidatus Hydrogenedentes bacterium]|nr:hypothetical protein [Candidatus Hydrogenedentota bacterium]